MFRIFGVIQKNSREKMKKHEKMKKKQLKLILLLSYLFGFFH